jgi:hypothetical protein
MMLLHENADETYFPFYTISQINWNITLYVVSSVRTKVASGDNGSKHQINPYNSEKRIGT